MFKAEQMFLLAVQERLAQQLLPQNDLQRVWQSLMLGLPGILPPQLALATGMPGTSQTLIHPLFQVLLFNSFIAYITLSFTANFLLVHCSAVVFVFNVHIHYFLCGLLFYITNVIPSYRNITNIGF
ncbi:unnamed protein product [Anisakis simplex]|uniref:Uncharacterized protein n=1 Tax=Anisakis simplex TaxID=6269 RepID=A0A0M3JBZ7_ANISI|nr:unnamed protein product [Anisakis simplex]